MGEGRGSFVRPPCAMLHLVGHTFTAHRLYFCILHATLRAIIAEVVIRSNLLMVLICNVASCGRPFSQSVH